MSDLWVGLDADGFYLWSAAHRRRVSVRETHLFNTFGTAPNLCRFVSLVESQGLRGIAGFPWGPASNLTYRPRVRSGRIVLSPRSWSFERSELGDDARSAKRAIDSWRNKWKMPRYVFLVEFDQRLLVDLDSSIAPDLILDQSKGRPLLFHEALPAPDQTWVVGKFGSYVVEFVASARCTQAVKRAESADRIVVSDRKRFGPGSAWTSARIYLGSQAMEEHLRSAIAPLVGELRKRELTDRWFFLRYADPESHIRLRFHAAAGNESATRDLFLTAAEEWLSGDRITRYALDTYDPEYERYGGPGNIEEIERFFELDSDACIAIIGAGYDSTDALTAAAAKSFDDFIRAGELDDAARAMLDGRVRAPLNAKDRASFKLLSAARPSFEHLPPVPSLRPTLSKPYLPDLLHMHCNRLGLRQEGELRVAALLRALTISRRARLC